MSKRCTPYTKTNIAPQYEYTDEMAKEDYRIARHCVYKKYATMIPEISIAKDDLVQWCVMRLWQSRPLYNKDKGKYTTYAFVVCRSVIFNQTIVKRQNEDLECLSLDYECTDENGNISPAMLETLGKPDKEYTGDLIKIIYKAVDNIQSPKFHEKAKQVVDLFLGGKVETCKQASDIIGCSREYVRQLVKKIRVNALEISNTGTCKRKGKRKRGRPLGCLDKEPRKLKQPADQKANNTVDIEPPKIDLDKMTFSQLRIAKGFTQKQIANQIGVDSSSVGYWCRKVYLPKHDKVEKLAKVFDCTFDQMQAIILR